MPIAKVNDIQNHNQNNNNKNKQPHLSSSTTLQQKQQPSPCQLSRNYSRQYKMHFYNSSSFIQTLSFMLIRPPRCSYNPRLLSPKHHHLARYKLTNFLISQDQKLQISLYTQQKVDYVILYLHGNSSNRLQTLLMLDEFPKNAGVACFDFKGCGNRVNNEEKQDRDKKGDKKGQFITLGWKQSKQVDQVAKYIKNNLSYKVVGWGRSMGAVSLLLCTQIDILIVDSPYCSLTRLCKQSQKKVLPQYLSCLSQCLYSYIFPKVKQKVFNLSGLQIQLMQITKKLSKRSKLDQTLQICFIHGQNDNLINFEHSLTLYQSFYGRKQFILFQGDHNDNRTKEVVEMCVGFIEEALEYEQIKKLEKNMKMFFQTKKNENQKLSNKIVRELESLKKKNKNKNKKKQNILKVHQKSKENLDYLQSKRQKSYDCYQSKQKINFNYNSQSNNDKNKDKQQLQTVKQNILTQ